jgi:hypothetical protein
MRTYLAARRKLLLLLLAIGIVVVTSRQILKWYNGPERVVSRAVGAIERGDARLIHSLILEKEVKDLGITESVVSRVLQEVLYSYAPRVKSVESKTTRGYGGYAAENWYRAFPAWIDASNGKTLPSRRGERVTQLDLFQMPDGHWKLSFTRFAWMGYKVNRPPQPIEKLSDAEWRRRNRQTMDLLASWGVREVFLFPDPPTRKIKGRTIALLDTPAYLRQLEVNDVSR